MTEPTLTELREIALMIVDCDIADNRIALAKAFLSLTDPTPLTAEHCREAGMQTMPVAGQSVNAGGDFVAVVFDDMGLTCYQPTVGQLRLALLQENSDGE